MRKIAATYIYPLTQAPIKYGILVCNNNGTIVDVIDKGEQFAEEAGVEFYSGIVVPGFVLEECNLLNHNKVSNRKMWAEGIAIAVDYLNSVYVVPERNGCQIQELETKHIKLREDSDPSTDGQIGDSFLEKMFHFQQNKQLKLTDLLLFSSLNVAKNLGLDSSFGSFESGKTPGVNLISGIDFQRMELTSSSNLKRLI